MYLYLARKKNVSNELGVIMRITYFYHMCFSCAAFSFNTFNLLLHFFHNFKLQSACVTCRNNQMTEGRLSAVSNTFISNKGWKLEYVNAKPDIFLTICINEATEVWFFWVWCWWVVLFKYIDVAIKRKPSCYKVIFGHCIKICINVDVFNWDLSLYCTRLTHLFDSEENYPRLLAVFHLVS